MRPDRFHMWLLLPLLVFIAGLMPPGLPSMPGETPQLVASQFLAVQGRHIQNRHTWPDGRATSFAASAQAGFQNQGQQSRGVRLTDVVAGLACLILSARRVRGALPRPVHDRGSMLFQLRTQSLQL